MQQAAARTKPRRILLEAGDLWLWVKGRSLFRAVGIEGDGQTLALGRLNVY
jgi:hypothetical protein